MLSNIVIKKPTNLNSEALDHELLLELIESPSDETLIKDIVYALSTADMKTRLLPYDKTRYFWINQILKYVNALQKDSNLKAHRKNVLAIKFIKDVYDAVRADNSSISAIEIIRHVLELPTLKEFTSKKTPPLEVLDFDLVLELKESISDGTIIKDVLDTLLTKEMLMTMNPNDNRYHWINEALESLSHLIDNTQLDSDAKNRETIKVLQAMKKNAANDPNGQNAVQLAQFTLEKALKLLQTSKPNEKPKAVLNHFNQSNKTVGNTRINPIVIVGMGPGGLAAAVEAARKGLPVIIIENRNYFSRIQRLRVNGKTFDFLDSLRDLNNADDTYFFEHQYYRRNLENGTRSKNGAVQVKDLQAYLLRKLGDFPNAKIMFGKDFQIAKIDPNNQSIALKRPDNTTQEVKFSHMIAADGSRHGAANMLNEATNNNNYKVRYNPLPVQHRQRAAGTATLELKPGITVDPDILPSRGFGYNFKNLHMKLFESLGWDKPYFPKVRVFRNEEGTKFFFSGEIPQSILEIKSKEEQTRALAQWSNLIISIEMNLDMDMLEFKNRLKAVNPANKAKYERTKEKDNIRATAFNMDLAFADKPAIELANGGAFILVGDANKNANFFYGHGLNDAIQDGLFAVQQIEGKHFNFSQYYEYQVRNLNLLVDRMNLDAGDAKDTNNIKSTVDRLKLLAAGMGIKVQAALQALNTVKQPGEENFDTQVFGLRLVELAIAIRNHLDAQLSKKENTRDANARLERTKQDFEIIYKDTEKALSRYFLASTVVFPAKKPQ